MFVHFWGKTPVTQRVRKLARASYGEARRAKGTGTSCGGNGTKVCTRGRAFCVRQTAGKFEQQSLN